MLLSIIGLDIHPDAVRLVALCQSRRSIHLSYSGIDKNLCSLLKPAERVSIAVPYTAVEVKAFSLDTDLKPTEIEALIADEFPPDQWLFDFHVSPNNVSVVSCQKSVIEPYLSLKPKIIDVDLFAVERVAYLIIKAFHRHRKTVAAFHANAQFCSLSVFENNQVIFRHYQSVMPAQALIQAYNFLESFPFEHLVLIAPPIVIQTITPQLNCSFSVHTPSHVISTTSANLPFHENNSDWTVACGLAL